MFKPVRWWSEKNRITVEFKFQFHATQVSEYGGSGLVLSVVSTENGKPSTKLEKCTIRENGCYWENPVYETVKLIQDLRTGKIHDRIYNFIISTGSSKGTILGEFSVNIADYVTAAKPCSIAFPFSNSNSNSHFHISIQRMQENSNLRDLEEFEGQNIAPDNRSLRQHLSNGDLQEGVKTDSIEDEQKTVSDLPELSGMHRGSSGSDITLSSSDSGSGVNTPREVGLRNNNANRDQNPNVLSYQDEHRTKWDLAIVPDNGLAADFSVNSPTDVFSSDRSQMGLDDSVEKLKTDFVALSRKAELSELELQTLRKQIVKESKKGQDMLKEITCLKEERDALKVECEKLKTSRKRADHLKIRSKFQFEGDPWALLEEIREELTYEKDLNANLRLQLQKTQESNSELLFAVQDLEEMLEKNNGSHLPNRSTSDESAIEIEESMLRCQSDDDEEQKALEELVRKHSGAQETYLLEQKIMDLSSELEMYRRDKDELEMQMEQLALDYEILKQENHEFSSRLEHTHLREQLKTQYESSGSYGIIVELESQRDRLQNELEEQSSELSHCLATIKELEAHNESLEEELDKQVERFEADKRAVARAQMEQEQRASRAEAALSQSTPTINELEAEIKNLKKENKQQLEEVSRCLAVIKELETHNCNLENKLEKQARESKAELEAFVNAKMEHEQRALQAEESVARSNATINELDSRIKELENELTMHSEASSGTLAELKELEAHIQNLEEELEKQAEGFEADLEAVTHAKVEQEQRAIRAEEALRLMKWKNANTAARLQDEFKRLSLQMQSSFEANEVVSSKAMNEATELRLQKHHLRDMLQKANEDLQSAKDDHEAKIQELYGQIEQKRVEFEEKSKQYENQGRRSDVSAQHSELKAEIERLTSENKLLSEQARLVEKLKFELEQMKKLIKEKDLLVQAENMERDELRAKIASVGEEMRKSHEEINDLRQQKDNKEQVVVDLHSEVENLRAQCDNLKHSLYEDELEKEKLRKQVFQLKADIKKKDETISSIEKKSKENSGRVVGQDRSRATAKNTKSEQLQRGSKEVGGKEVATLKEKIKLLERQIKSKETALETSSNAFLAKERELQYKIEELEIRLGLLEQSSPESSQHEVEEKVSVGMQVDLISEASISPENLNNIDPTNSDVQTLADTEPRGSDNNSEQQKYDVLLKEIVVLKERNNSMEIELREMQERYSDISLKFAEVEGERQQLVMRLRNLKNARKS